MNFPFLEILQNILSVCFWSEVKLLPQKMVRHTQTIRRQQPTNCLSVCDHFVEMALKGLKISAVVVTWTVNTQHLRSLSFRIFTFDKIFTLLLFIVVIHSMASQIYQVFDKVKPSRLCKLKNFFSYFLVDFPKGISKWNSFNSIKRPV